MMVSTATRLARLAIAGMAALTAPMGIMASWR
jgi:hypothetical protein